MTVQPTLLSPRLTLRPYRLDDVEALEALAWAPEIVDTTVHSYQPGASGEWIGTHAALAECGKGFFYAIERSESAEFVGHIDLMITPAHRRGTLGYWIGFPHWKQGYATEAAATLVDYAFGPLGLNGIIAAHFTRNPASGNVLQKLGMRREGTRRQFFLKDGTFEDMDTYWMLASDWKIKSEVLHIDLIA